MAGYDGRGARFDVVAVEGADLSFTVTAVDAAGDAVDLSAATITASVYNGDGTVVDELSDAVSGAGSNVITLSLTDTEVDALVVPKSWALEVSRGGDERIWLAGAFSVQAPWFPRTSTTGTAVTATVDTNVVVTAAVLTSAGGASTLAALSDVTVTTPVSGQALTYDGSGWVNSTPAGGGDLLAANNLSDLANAATARTNLGVVIGTDVQAFDADLTALANANNSATLAAIEAGDLSKLDGIEAGAQVNTVTPANTVSLTNKTLASFTNDVDADHVHVQVRNDSGATIAAGTPVHVSGYNIGQEIVLVVPADASDVSTMPCLGITEESIVNNANGSVVRVGRIENVDTSAFSVGDVLYVSETAGALTAARPTAPAISQQVATVLRVHASLGVLSVSETAALIPATTTAVGGVELATNAETITGTDTERAVTPAGGAAAYDVMGAAAAAQAASQPLDADLTTIAAANNGATLAATTAAFTTADESKLDGIEALADVTDATNVTAAGALMDSEVTNLAAVKAFDPADYATAAQGAKADTALQPTRVINAQTGTTYTLVLTDSGKTVTCSNAAAVTLTVPPNASVAFPVGASIDIIGIGAGIVTVAAGAGVTVNATPSLVFRAQHSGASLLKLATDTWALVGDLASP